LTYGLAFLIPFAADHWTEWSGEEAVDRIPKWDFSSASFWYQRIVTLGFREARPHYASLVVITPDDLADGGSSPICAQRSLLAKLVESIASYRPSAIVIDKYFDPKSCADVETNGALIRAVGKVSATVPIVIGALEDTYAEARLDHPHVAEAAARFEAQDPLLVLPDLFPDPAIPLRGLVRLNKDVRKIPTWWPAWLSYRPDEPPRSMMSWRAGRHEARSRAAPTARWKRMRHVHPYTGFIPERRRRRAARPRPRRGSRRARA
jgi:hypothetical protein